MDINLQDYHIVTKLFAGTSLHIIFQHKTDKQSQQVLELQEVAGFIELPGTEALTTLVIEAAGGDFYASALSARLNQPEIASFPEAILFTDEDRVHHCLHVCARHIAFRKWTANDKKVN